MKKDIPTHPWQIMSFAKDLFGLPFMRRLIGAMNAIKAEKHPNVVKSLFSKHRDETKQTENRYSIDYFKDHKGNGCKYA